jgi:hypothetical protein
MVGSCGFSDGAFMNLYRETDHQLATGTTETGTPAGDGL